MGPMLPEHKRFIFVEHGIGSALFNLALNGAIAWLLFRSLDRIPLWGSQSIAGDTIGTCFFLPFFTALIVTPLARRRVRRGQVGALGSTPGSPSAARWLPRATLPYAAVLGIVCTVLVGSLTVWSLHVLAVHDLAFWGFVAFKGLFAGALAAVVTPLIAHRALVPQPVPSIDR